MTIKVDGTNGVLQTYDFQVLTTGFTYTFAAGTTTLIANPAATLATGTITMPAAPADGMVITIQSTQQITALTIQGNTGQSLVAGAITMRANQPESFVYRLSNTTWYPFAGAANTQIISGTTVASTSGTSIDFTGIPSWVKRITVMFNGVSLNSSATMLIQLGDSGGVETSGYSGIGMYITTGPGATVNSSGFLVNNIGTATQVMSGNVIICLLDAAAYVWSASGTLVGTGTYNQVAIVGGAKTLSATLDRVRITSTSGTDTFDAGSINILYE